MSDTLITLAKKVRNTVNRQSSAFIRVWNSSESAYEFRNMGRITDGSVESEPVASDADQDGRESSQLFTFTVQFMMMQASSEEIEMLEDLALPEDETNYPNGHTIYFSGDKLLTSDLNASLTNDLPDYTILGDTGSDPSDPNGICFVNVLLKPSLSFNLDGETSMIGLEFTGRTSTKAFNGFDDNTQEDGNHIVISPE